MFHENEIGENFYIIETGTVECVKETKKADGTVSVDPVRELSVGDHFGEIALL